MLFSVLVPGWWIELLFLVVQTAKPLAVFKQRLQRLQKSKTCSQRISTFTCGKYKICVLYLTHLCILHIPTVCSDYQLPFILQQFFTGTIIIPTYDRMTRHAFYKLILKHASLQIATHLFTRYTVTAYCCIKVSIYSPAYPEQCRPAHCRAQMG